eukprot:CAMPEP_0172396812 /NCGR_PEP_ID=MMETSP1061-20121228/27166_1 /TAXON_ID=37318 /ORGANISM="Pseudo-nitzschia pungens, Strain cf. pungens" /LENGTH=446 /DNA_ID=CAMNT_0013128779 /DNA_START=11 /DNA_END=1351 /DNA_ORIENTATION=+
MITCILYILFAITLPVASFVQLRSSFNQKLPVMVHLHGQASLSVFRRSSLRRAKDPSNNNRNNRNKKKNLTIHHRPLDPNSILQSPQQLNEKALLLAEWLSSKRNVFCLTGAGLSTDSGIPDYRGHRGSYHQGHKPIVHQQFMDSSRQRRRYWGRSMVGWKTFETARPNKGHYSLAAMEKMGVLGVNMEDRIDFYDDFDKDDFFFTSGQRRLAVLTQNVDSLHDRAGSKDVLALHGANKVVRCMNCGHRMPRNDYQEQLAEMNRDWLDEQQDFLRLRNQEAEDSSDHSSGPRIQLRPDGDAELPSSSSSRSTANYDSIRLPPCPCCADDNKAFFKADVVFFGDAVPKHRVRICEQAVENCDGILVVGSSLAVHSAFRHVKAAAGAAAAASTTRTTNNNPVVAILNVGETRAEVEGLEGLLKIEAPIGDTLERCVELMGGEGLLDCI